MKIKWKYNCYLCECPLDIFYKKEHRYETKLLDKFMELSELSFQNNVSMYKFFGLKVKRVCKCCFEMKISYNPHLHTMRQCGIMKLGPPPSTAISYRRLGNWARHLNIFIDENKPK